MGFPELIRIEVKTTTSEQVPLPARELEALATKGNAEAGILAALFWCGDRNVDGRWLIADAEQTFRKSGANAISVSKANMVRAHRSQPWLADLKEHITNNWPGFLHAFFNDAMSGHEVLCVVLADCHAAGNIAERLPKERILDTDHRDAVRSIIEQHGESVAGHVFQDLFAYLVGYAGYADVIRDGVLSVGYYNFFFGYPYYVDGVFSARGSYVDFNSVRSVDGAFRFTFKGGTPWAVFSLSVRENNRTVGRAAADFTRFDRIRVEAKGASGGERLLLHLKDKNDPDDGTQTNVEIVLGTDWETYEFSLSDFETADLSALHLALGFLMLNEASPVSFSVRTVKFLKPAGQEIGGET